ncbi:MAG: RimK family alpha-L-glutamate ligase [Desulfobacterales bacterium]|mgnify:CR=1 FL=1|jgi:ribosomal protein S6--L-glutamate ligase|nr:RimK family alpha-L-glutamate ligase [Desulfobacteraceae bacterium]MBT4365686.1 RimK family alpha-L-glutamate ligase [Desulfobacteraceae bacterium]MBT7086326.1 RimK family alpha-L-glutamate ligase [Desulfobacterales bacterium]MBT7696733.1 RimK family alpha-L-glutamate ligase [Desulfobacterales bacterium]
MAFSKKIVALGSRLKKCRNVITIGVKPDFSEYDPEDKKLIQNESKIYYPSEYYAELFDVFGKNIFPSYQNYRFAQDKIKQSAAFNIFGLPHPRTKVFYGKRQKDNILNFFQFPFIGKIPRGSAKGNGVFFIRNNDDLATYLELSSPAYIQEYLETDRGIRVVIIGTRVVHAYWRIAPVNEFRCNVSVGAEIRLGGIPEGALALALEVAHKCKWDDVGIDIIEYKNNYFILEANMKYGMEGFRKAGIDYIKLMETMIENNEI